MANADEIMARVVAAERARRDAEAVLTVRRFEAAEAQERVLEAQAAERVAWEVMERLVAEAVAADDDATDADTPTLTDSGEGDV